MNIGYSKEALELKFSEKESLLQDLASSIETILFTREEEAKKEKEDKEEGQGSDKKVVRDDKEEVLRGKRRRTRKAGRRLLLLPQGGRGPLFKRAASLEHGAHERRRASRAAA